MDKDLMITISAALYEELLQANIQSEMMLNIVNNVSSYDIAAYIRNVFNIDLKGNE